jgi:hypothetical protein
MNSDKTTSNQNQIVGFVFIFNAILIFAISFVLSLGNSISDGTLMLCMIFFAIGTHLTLSENKSHKEGG